MQGGREISGADAERRPTAIKKYTKNEVQIFIETVVRAKPHKTKALSRRSAYQIFVIQMSVYLVLCGFSAYWRIFKKFHSVPSNRSEYLLNFVCTHMKHCVCVCVLAVHLMVHICIGSCECGRI